MISDYELELAFTRLKWHLAVHAFEESARRFGQLIGAKYDPNQPRDDHGRWTDGGDSQAGNADDIENAITDQRPLINVARRISTALEARCLDQYARDTFHCTMVGLRACHAQAALRYSNCLRELPIPPLNY
jgi:hypothetical protein